MRAAWWVVAVVAVAVAGCGGGEEPAATATRAARTSVEVTFDPDGRGGAAARRARLTCPSARRAAACRALEALPADALAPPAGEVACTQIYGGPETGSIRGVVAGRRVDADYARTDGCAIARFDRVEPVLRAAGG